MRGIGMSTNWGYDKIFERFKESLPPEFKDKPNGQPVPVVTFQGVPCSIYGTPLEKALESVSFDYKEVNFPRFNASTQRKLREKNGFIQVIYPGEAVRKGQFLLVHHTVDGEQKPIIEVSDGGRAVLRARQWCRVLDCDFDKEIDERVVVSEEKYREFLLKLSENICIWVCEPISREPNLQNSTSLKVILEVTFRLFLSPS